MAEPRVALSSIFLPLGLDEQVLAPIFDFEITDKVLHPALTTDLATHLPPASCRSNILVKRTDSGRYRCVLSDFGCAGITLTDSVCVSTIGQNVPTSQQSQAFTPGYTAPEVLAEPSTKKRPPSDVFAFGCVLFHLFAGRAPFAVGGGSSGGVVEQVLSGQRPSFVHTRTPLAVQQLVERCWCQDPYERPTAQQLLRQLEGLVRAGEAAWSRPLEDLPVVSGWAAQPSQPLFYTCRGCTQPQRAWLVISHKGLPHPALQLHHSVPCL